MGRMGSRMLQQRQSSPETKIAHIHDHGWNIDTLRVPEILTDIRQHSSLTKIIAEDPEIDTWLNQAYTDQDIDVEIRNLANRKAHSND